jgi:hypothetical protein
MWVRFPPGTITFRNRVNHLKVRPKSDQRGLRNEQHRRVETVEKFKLRIAAIIQAKPEQIPAAKRLRRLKRATNPKAKWRTTR